MNCSQYVDKVLSDIQKTHSSLRSRAAYEKRDFLYYSWLLQTRELSVNRAMLTRLTGISYKQQDAILEEMPLIGRGKYNEAFLTLSDEMLAAIGALLESQEQAYLLSQEIPEFDGLLGRTYIELFNGLSPISNIPTLSLDDLITNALRRLLSGVSIYNVTGFGSGIHVVVGPQNHWGFVLVVQPHTGVMSEIEIQALMGLLFATLEATNALLKDIERTKTHILVIAPSVNVQAEKLSSSVKTWHHLWCFSSLRFFHLLDRLVESYSADVVSEYFIAIFDPQEVSGVFSARNAIDHIEQWIKRKQFLFPVALTKGEDGIPVFRIALMKEKENSRNLTFIPALVGHGLYDQWTTLEIEKSKFWIMKLGSTTWMDHVRTRHDDIVYITQQELDNRIDDNTYSLASEIDAILQQLYLYVANTISATSYYLEVE